MKKLKCIIVEGADNTGKDTLCEQIKSKVQNETGRLVIYVCPKYEPLTDDYLTTQKNLKDFTEEFINMPDRYLLLLNRSWFDEIVYGPMYRNYPENTLDWAFDLSDDFKQQTLMIRLWDEPEVLVSREDGKSLSKGDSDRIRKELQLFENIECRLQECGVRTISIKSSDYPKDRYVCSVENEILNFKSK